MSGDYHPDRGRILVDGEAKLLRSPRDAHDEGIYVVYQEPEMALPLTVAENLLIGIKRERRGHYVSVSRLISEARDLIEQEGFADILDPAVTVDRCSPAQRQCIEILKAIRTGVRVLCLDEPTSSLSEDATRHLWGLIERLRSIGTAIVYVSHRMAEIKRLCQAVVIMRDGRVVAEHESDGLSEGEMISLMVGRPLSRFFPDRRSQEGDVLLRVRGVTSEQVSDVSFDLQAGEILGIGGLVGAGRTELARAICGADPISSGSIEIDGRALRLRSPKDAIRAGICLAPEDRRGEALILARSIVENISLPALSRLTRMRVVRRGAEWSMASGAAQRMRVKAHSLRSAVSTLSGGNQQKVVIARWVTMKPKVLVLDEPTRGIDVGTKVEIYELMDELVHQGVAIIFISSELPELLGVADRLLVMRAGRVVAEFPADQATEELVLTTALGDGAAA
jgi:L-arabinose transport system ATP-binding protein